MAAKLLQRDRIEFDDGAFISLVIWEVPKPVPGSSHSYKYRLYYGWPKKRVVGYDNEATKGDHRHVDDNRESYTFKDIESLVRDFLAEVEKRRPK